MTDREHGMIGEKECVRDDVPRCLPGQVFFIKQNAHQFRNSQCGVGLRNGLNQVAPRLGKVY